MKEKDIYIKILEYGINHVNGFTYNEIMGAKELKELKGWELNMIDKYLLNAYRNKQYIEQMKPADLETMFFTIEAGGSNYKDNTYKYGLNLDSRFKYIDYIELKETREMSRNANRNAIIAISITIITTFVSILLTLWQIKSPIEIESKQVDYIINKISNTIKN